MMNPTLSDLVGGIHAVTLSDDEAKRRGTQKTVLERKAPPTFDVVIEIIEVDKLALHLDVERTVDRMLRGGTPRPEIRIRNEQGEIEVIQRSEEPGSIRELPERGRGDSESRRSDERDRGRKLERTENPNGRESRTGRVRWDSSDGTRQESREDTADEASRSSGSARLTPRTAAPAPAAPPQPAVRTSALRVFPYGVSRSRLDRAIAEIHVPAYIARDIGDADVVLALKATYKREPGKMREATQKRLPIYTVRSNTYAQIANCIRELFGLTPSYESAEDEMEAALLETQDAIDSVKMNNEAMELAPANSYTRRLQHQLVERYQLVSESVGVEPQRRVRILPVGS